MSERLRGLVLAGVTFGGLGLIYLGTQIAGGDESPTQPTQPKPTSGEKETLRIGFTELEVPASSSTPFATATEKLSQAQEVAQLESGGFDCQPIPKNSWVTKELRRRGKLENYHGPYYIVFRNGNKIRYESYGELPHDVHLGDELCVENIKPDSFFFDHNQRGGDIFSRSQQLNHQKLSMAAQARRRSSFGYQASS